MIRGTGPGRGVPWWRRDFVYLVWKLPGFSGSEPLYSKREGRVVAKVGTP